MLNKHNPEIIFLSETKQQSRNLKKILGNIGVTNFWFVEPKGKAKTAGGLVLAWKTILDITIEDFSDHHINATIKPLHGEPWLFTGYYGSPFTTNGKLHSWNMIENTCATNSLPWLIMGDCNFVLHEHEKFSQHPINQAEADIFLRKIEEAHFSDLSYTECPFTWTNKRTGPHLTEQRLDIGLPNEAWLDIQPNTTISNLTAIGSDHNLIIINTNPNWKLGQIPFKFFGPWINHEDCKSIIVECWNTVHKGSLSIKIARKLRDIKVRLKQWNKEVYGNIKLGDRNTGYFHIAIKKRYRRNKIDSIQKEDGTWIQDNAEITKTFTNHFANMATAETITINPFIIKLIPTTITLQENQNLLRTAEPLEIKNILFSMAGDKAPGPNGFPKKIFQANWDIVGEDIIHMVENFFTYGHILKEMNSTFISLIPKTDKPTTPAQFRPISLCNTTYKIISKLIAQRLKPLLPKIISPFQSSFIHGRKISDNIAIAYEIIHHMNTRRGKKGSNGTVGIKIDMAKAFDRVNWDFLLQVLSQMGFSSQWFNLIHQCISTTSMAVLVNGSPGKFFKPSRGLRQGDPLSPYLFLFCMKALSRYLTHAETQQQIHGIKI
ncbi:uncharacterized protein LOC113312760 [Papaver somniferum]|uniref:uncharacterized protein LOC113312760 n=1 Tax=Papaver somniferum TaxID=3469 RepID=UPI000E6FAA13|nr:uncharacterized protein LOC113312760 [Papaver somniferum]